MKIVFENINKKFGDVYAVKNLNLTIKSGALHSLLGPSGCGKTTTLRMLAGLEQPTSGRIFFDDKDVTNMPAAERGVGMVFQNYALWPHMTVKKNVEYGLRLRKFSSKEMHERVSEVLNMTQITTLADRFPSQLSGGQQQRVALARALAIRPNVLLLDEPLSNLDAQLRTEMRERLAALHAHTGITTVYVTHDQHEALSMSTQVSVMSSGQLIQTDTPRRLYKSPKNALVASFVGEANIMSARYVAETTNGNHIVKTPLGEFSSTNCVGQFAKDQKVAIAIRPENICLCDGSEEVDNTFECVVKHQTYLGGYERLSVSTKTGTDLSVTLNNPLMDALEPGSVIECGVLAKNMLILPSSDGFDTKI